MKKGLLFPLGLFVLFLTVSFNLQTGKIFPSLTGETIAGKKVSIPTDTKGKYTLVGIAWSQKAQDDLETWFQPVYTMFIEKPDKDDLFNDPYDFNIYFIPVFSGANESMYGTAKKRLQDKLDPGLKPYVLLYKGSIAEYKKQLNMEDKDKPYFFVLDPEGKIVYTTSGAYSEEKMDKIEQWVAEG